MNESAAHLRVMEETPAYWRVVFDYPPFNIVDATIFEGLQDLLVRKDLCVPQRHGTPQWDHSHWAGAIARRTIVR
jgi:hypothetical protein